MGRMEVRRLSRAPNFMNRFEELKGWIRNIASRQALTPDDYNLAVLNLEQCVNEYIYQVQFTRTSGWTDDILKKREKEAWDNFFKRITEISVMGQLSGEALIRFSNLDIIELREKLKDWKFI